MAKKKKSSGDGEKPEGFSLVRAKELLEKKDYTSAARLLSQALETDSSDEIKRLLVRSYIGLEDFPRAVVAAAAVESKGYGDFADLAFVQFHAGAYDDSLVALEKCLLLKDTPWAHFFKSFVIRRGKERYLLDGSLKKQVLDELAAAISLPNCLEGAFLEYAEIAGFDETKEVLERALTTYPQYRNVRMKVAEWTVWREPQKCVDTLESLLPENAPSQLGLGAQALINLSAHERALALLARFPEEEQKKPGFAKIKGDLLVALGRSEEAVKEFEIEIASDNVRSQITGLFSRANVRLKEKDYDSAVKDAKNALALCFEHDNFDFFDGWYWFPHLNHYSFDEAIHSVCKALDINDAEALSGCEDTVRWQARFLEWMQTYQREGMDSSDRRLKDFETHLTHPCVSKVLMELYQELGNSLEAVRHHFLYKRWQVAKSQGEENDHYLSYLYFEDKSLPKKMETQKIHRLALAELEACKSADEVRLILVPFYKNVWRQVLKKHEMYDEMASVSETLLRFAKDDADLLWDFAFSNSDSGNLESEKKSEWGYRELLKIRPKNSAACYNLSLALERQGKIEEAWEYVEQAYKIDPKDKDFERRYQRFSELITEKKRQEKNASVLRSTTEATLARPVPFESLTLRQRLYLSSLLRCCLTEDRAQILSVAEAPGKLTPSADHTQEVLRHLWHSDLIAIDPASPPSSYTVNEKGQLSVFLDKVRWKLNIASTKKLSPAMIVGKLLDPEMVSDGEIDEGIELWREVALEESLEYLQHAREEVRLHAEIGDKTREMIAEILNSFSTAQIYMIIYSVVPRALADYESGKYGSRLHAANAIPGRCQAYADRAKVERWNLTKYRRNFNCKQSIVSETLFNRYLMIGTLGFDNRPGDFGGARFAIEVSGSSTPLLE